MWKLIEQLNWAKRSQTYRGYAAGKEYMLDIFTPEECKAIRQFAEKRKSDLYNRVTTYESQNDCRCGDYSGDDSFGDMLWHVVGLGKKVYDMVMENPKLLYRVKYVECFGYMLPYDDEFPEPDSPEMSEAKEVIRSLIAALDGEGLFGTDVVTDALAFLRK